MGFSLKSIFKPVAKAIDPLLPESVKSVAAKVDESLGELSIAGSILSGVQNETQDAAAPAEVATTTSSTLSDAEAENISSKRLARLGRYFTSPLGVLGNASTGSQKIFS